MDRVPKRRKRRPSPPVFKPYHQHQLMLLPPSLEELIAPNHLVRVINEVVDKLDIGPILSTYKGGGTSSYHPRMLLKVLLYGYVEGIYTTRRIAKALRENVHFMWLSGMSYPDFRTLNNFRSGRLKEHIDSVFASLLLMLVEEGYVDLEHYFVDGSKFQANAGRYSYVWRKNVKRYKKKLQERIESILAQIDRLNAEEDHRYGERDLPELGEGVSRDAHRLDERVSEINEVLHQINPVQEQRANGGNKEGDELNNKGKKDKGSGSGNSSESDQLRQRVRDQYLRLRDLPSGPERRKRERLLKELNTRLLPRLQRYEHQERLLGNRNSYSKTDEGATFYRNKDGVLLAGYNVIMGSQHQFILNYSVHQNFADNACFISHMSKFYGLLGGKPGAVIGDAGFGTEENYHHLEEKGIDGYLKHPRMKKRSSSRRKSSCSHEQFHYDEERDVYTCPEGRELHFIEERERTKATGYRAHTRIYKCVSCEGCPRRSHSGDRRLEVSPMLQGYRRKVEELLSTEDGKRLFRRRGVEIESIFGHIKHNRNYRRFLLRGLEKVNIELGLLSIAHNVLKIFSLQGQEICPV